MRRNPISRDLECTIVDLISSMPGPKANKKLFEDGVQAFATLHVGNLGNGTKVARNSQRIITALFLNPPRIRDVDELEPEPNPSHHQRCQSKSGVFHMSVGGLWEGLQKLGCQANCQSLIISACPVVLCLN